MKKSLVVLLSLGLVLVFSMSAFAAPADFYGHLRWRGWYADNPTMKDKSVVGVNSAAFVEQRLRLGGNIKLLDGVETQFRFDVLEDFWMTSTPASYAAVVNSNPDQTNIMADVANMTFSLPFGKFLVGYTNAPLGYGTKFWESGEGIRPVVRYTVNAGPVEYRATWEKKSETQGWGNNSVGITNGDSDIYALAGKYKGKNIEAGMQWQYLIDNSKRPLAAASNGGYSTQLHALQPYFKGTFGNFYIESELLYVGGKAKAYDEPRGGFNDVDAKAKGAFINAKYTMGPAWLAFAASYTSGDDHSTPDTVEGSVSQLFDGASSDGGSSSPKPTLILTNTSFGNFFGSLKSSLSATDQKNANSLQSSNLITTHNDNEIQFTLYGGYAVTKQLDINWLLTMAQADQKPYNSTSGKQFISNEIGKEFDLAIFYKITPQLTYNPFFTYFWTGDYFKGTNSAALVANNFLFMHALLLEF